MSPNKALVVASHTLLSPFTKNQFKRFIVLSRSRTGSNLLLSFLNSHPHIHSKSEIFRKLDKKNYKNILERVFSGEPNHLKAKGFKIFYYHPIPDDFRGSWDELQSDNSCGIWDELKSSTDLHVIHLKRRNILRTLLSRKIAELQNVWSVRSSKETSNISKEEVFVNFTVEELIQGFTQTRYWEERGDEMFESHPLLSIDYENLILEPASTFRKVTDFLGVRYIKPKTDLKKQSNRSMKETITNYDELKSYFSQTQWGIFFED